MSKTVTGSSDTYLAMASPVVTQRKSYTRGIMRPLAPTSAFVEVISKMDLALVSTYVSFRFECYPDTNHVVQSSLSRSIPIRVEVSVCYQW